MPELVHPYSRGDCRDGSTALIFCDSGPDTVNKGDLVTTPNWQQLLILDTHYIEDFFEDYYVYEVRTVTTAPDLLCESMKGPCTLRLMYVPTSSVHVKDPTKTVNLNL